MVIRILLLALEQQKVCLNFRWMRMVYDVIQKRMLLSP